jgi:ligand-binding sensor domain-containing protein
MTRPLPKYLLLALWAWILFLTSCFSQSATNQKQGVNEAVNSDITTPKIIRTLGTKSGAVRCELIDNYGHLWISISGEGVYRYDGAAFCNFTAKDGLCNNDVGPIIQDQQGHILFGTKRGICAYDGQSFNPYPIPDSLSITCMLETKEGVLWFGTMNHGVYSYDGKNLDNYLNSNDPIYNLGNNNQLILDILEDKVGNIWFSSWNGGGVWKFDGEHFKNFLPPLDYYQSNQDNRNVYASNDTTYIPSEDFITDDMIFSMTEDHVGNIWFATRNHGVCIYNGHTFSSWGKEQGFTSHGATTILQDDQHGFWIGTWDAGVWYYDGHSFRHFTEADGLVSNAVMHILQDKMGQLWFGTKYFGLSRYDHQLFTTLSNHEP